MKSSMNLTKRFVATKILSSLLVVFLILPTVSAQGPTNESDWRLVENLVQLYFDGWATGDKTKLDKAMHFSCRLKNYVDGKFIEYDKATYLGLFKSPPRPRPHNLQTKIVAVDLTGIIGSVKAEITTPNDVFTDYFNVMKTNEGWFIVDKVAVRTPRKSAETPQTTTSERGVKPEKEVVLEDLKRPWSIAFLSEEEALVTEKEGNLVRVDLRTKQKVKIKGFPDDVAKPVDRGDNAGIFEVLLDPDFSRNKFVYVSYAASNEQGSTTKVIRAVLENDTLSGVETLLLATPYTRQCCHYGGGMTFGRDGKLYLTVGERLFREIDEPTLPIAQNVEDKRGKIYRLNPDGSVPTDNPDFGPKAVPGLYAIGIRAAQGVTVEPATNKIWFSEHGTIQGDEINVLKAQANYGWPIKTSGRYRSADYVPPAAKETVFTGPSFFWLQTVAPTGLVFYTGDEFPLWKNDLFVAGLAEGSLWRFRVEGETIKSVEEIFVESRVRLRKVAQSPKGTLYVLTDETNGKVIRIRNANAK